jgi:hypothetical protein
MYKGCSSGCRQLRTRSFGSGSDLDDLQDAAAILSDWPTRDQLRGLLGDRHLQEQRVQKWNAVPERIRNAMPNRGRTPFR